MADDQHISLSVLQLFGGWFLSFLATVAATIKGVIAWMERREDRKSEQQAEQEDKREQERKEREESIKRRLYAMEKDMTDHKVAVALLQQHVAQIAATVNSINEKQDRQLEMLAHQRRDDGKSTR